MPHLYGIPISVAENTELIARLRVRGTRDATAAAVALGTTRNPKSTATTALQVRDAILLELREWEDLANTTSLAALRDRLKTATEGDVMSTPERQQDADPDKASGYGANANADDSDEASEQGGEVGDAIRRGADDEDAFDRDADEGGEVGEAIRRSTEEP